MQRLIGCLVLIFLGFGTLAQDTLATSQDSIQPEPKKADTLVVGIKHTPPFVILEEGMDPNGLSIKMWESISQKFLFRYKVYPDLESLMTAVRSGEADLSINPVTVTSQRLEEYDFSQPFFISETSFANKDRSGFLAILKNLISWKFIGAILILLLIIFGFGVLAWYFERKNNEEFQGSTLKGIGQGFWWSAVTMTTVGYGDKSPRSLGGRIIGFIWMFTAVIIISSITATIASSLTVSNLESDIHNVRDLKGQSVGTVDGSSSAEFLDLYNVDSKHFESVQKGLEAVEKNDIRYFVYDKPVLQYYKDEASLDDLVVNQDGLKTDYYSFLYPLGFKAKGELDRLIVDQLKSPEWQLELERFRANGN